MITLNVTDNAGNQVTTHPLDGSVVEPLLTAKSASRALVTNAFGTVTRFVAKASAGRLLSLRATNANAAVRYLQIHNTASTPASAAVPTGYSFPIPAGTAASPGVLQLTEEFFGAGGSALATGISVVVSTTLGTFTDSATAADHVVHVHTL